MTLGGLGFTRGKFEDLSAAFRTLTERRLTRKIQFGRRLFRSPGFAFAFLCPRRSRFKFEPDLAFLESKKSFEGAAFLRNEFIDEICFACLEQLLHLGFLDRPLQNDFARAEVAGAIRADRFLADIAHRGLENPRTAFGTFADGFLPREVDLLSSFPISLAGPKIELRSVFSIQF